MTTIKFGSVISAQCIPLGMFLWMPSAQGEEGDLEVIITVEAGPMTLSR
jgi:hypothetical protein